MFVFPTETQTFLISGSQCPNPPGQRPDLKLLASSHSPVTPGVLQQGKETPDFAPPPRGPPDVPTSTLSFFASPPPKKKQTYTHTHSAFLATPLPNRETTVPVSPSKSTFPHWLGTSKVHNLFLKTQTIAYTQKYEPAYFPASFSLHPPPPPETLCQPPPPPTWTRGQ